MVTKFSTQSHENRQKKTDKVKLQENSPARRVSFTRINPDFVRANQNKNKVIVSAVRHSKHCLCSSRGHRRR